MALKLQYLGKGTRMKNNLNLILIIGISLFSISSYANNSCRDYVSDGSYTYFREVCNELGELIEKIEYLKDGDKIYARTWFQNDIPIKKVNYPSSGGFNLRTYAYFEDKVTITTFKRDSSTVINSKQVQFQKSGREIETWSYEKGEASLINYFSESGIKVLVRKAFPQDEEYYDIDVDLSRERKDYVSSFSLYKSNGIQTGKYVREFNGDILKIIENQNLEEQEVLRRKNIYQNTSRPAVVVIDSGFDIRHESLSYKMFNSKLEDFGLEDRDQNGLVGDKFGWRFDSSTSQGSNINESIILGSFKPIPLSHGTHVSSIALQNQEGYGLLGYAGDISSPEFLSIISEGIRDKNVKFANISWGFKAQGLPMTPKPESYEALKNLIFSSASTLFFVASGNNGWDIDKDYEDYPASYQFNNLIVIGALNVPDLDWMTTENVIPAVYKNGGGSNTGKKSVDIFSPGKNVLGAKLGGGEVRLSGTSMASPFALNGALEALSKNEALTNFEIKEILLKTASYFTKDLPCLSRGVLNPKRASYVSSLLKENPNLSIEEAVLNSRSLTKLRLMGEKERAFQDLKEIWIDIDNAQNINTP
jgi:hypothetical protein